MHKFITDTGLWLTRIDQNLILADESQVVPHFLSFG